MFLVRWWSRRVIAVSLAFSLTLFYVVPSVAIACEGGGEEANTIAITPIEWGKGAVEEKKKCPVNNIIEKKTEFTELGQWCEYEIKNERNEEVTIESYGQTANKKACNEFVGGELCLNFRAPKAGNTVCNVTVKLAGKGSCFDRLQYTMKPKGVAESEMGLYVETKTKPPGNKVAKKEVRQIVK